MKNLLTLLIAALLLTSCTPMKHSDTDKCLSDNKARNSKNRHK